MEIARFIYQDNPNYEVEFEPTCLDNVMVNATMMAAIFGKKVNHFMENDNTKSFISACLKRANKTGIPVYSDENIPANCGFYGIKKESDLVISKKKSGTWMHRILALKFAAWLDPDFEVWVFETIDLILNQAYSEERNARQRKIYAKARKEALKIELLAKYPDFKEYFDLLEKIKEADGRIIKSIKEQIKQLELEFIPELLNPSQS
jgi:hypothetical protein